MSFIFPADHFPIFNAIAVPGIPPEEFGPPLCCNPYSALYKRAVSGIEGGARGGYEFVPKDEEISQKRMEVLYNVVDDAYVRRVRGNKKSKSEWKNGVWRCCNVDRKVEHDWGMAYLARKDIDLDESAPQYRQEWKSADPGKQGSFLKGVIEWRFNLRKAGLRVKNLELRVPYKVYRDGDVVVTVCSRDDYTVLLDSQTLKSVPRAVGWDDFVIRAELSGVQGIAYQNAQLFRQPLKTDRMNEEWKHPFKVVIEMEEAQSS
ncbi:peptide-N(4)-(N-acetyl-beta-glucosaminyl)asparagine amidase-like isoform X2 [Paramacrobiotus metropolitanus]|nr:peptide-N(4)-(N-acetyl-beta-glucosaminyl)asparagine amidase-like isoform X2 [Paramacrobiotus metropolitanus]